MNESRFDFEQTKDSITVTRQVGQSLPAWWEDWEIQQGGTLYLPITYQDGQTQEIIDLSSGFTANLVIVQNYGDSAALESLTESDGITLASSTPNIVIERTGAQTAAYDWVRAVFSLEVIETSGTVTTPVLAGFVTLRKEAVV